MNWAEQLLPSSDTDRTLRIVLAAFLFLWNWIIGTHLTTAYPHSLIDIYALPLTRIFLLIIVLLAALWCPTVGILAAMAYVFLGADTLFLTRTEG